MSDQSDQQTENRAEYSASSAMLLTAINLAAEAHKDQVDLQGRPYFKYHLAEIAGSLRPFGIRAETVGWLHDIREDTEVQVEDIINAGITDPIVHTALDAMTRRPSEEYFRYVRRAKRNSLARVVKLADNWWNLTQCTYLPEEQRTSRQERYLKARRILTDPGSGDW